MCFELLTTERQCVLSYTFGEVYCYILLIQSSVWENKLFCKSGCGQEHKPGHSKTMLLVVFIFVVFLKFGTDLEGTSETYIKN